MEKSTGSGHIGAASSSRVSTMCNPYISNIYDYFCMYTSSFVRLPGRYMDA